MGLVLTLEHNIHLTREERYILAKKDSEVSTIGCCIPVWFLKGSTSEPAKEIFCKYNLYNFGEEMDSPIQILKDGFDIVLPFRKSKKKIKKLIDEDWRKLSDEQKNSYYDIFDPIITPQNLLDVKDSGSECIRYIEHNKIKLEEKSMTVIHYVSIQDVSILEDNL